MVEEECVRKALCPSLFLPILCRSSPSAVAGSRPSIVARSWPPGGGGRSGRDDLSDSEPSSSGEDHCQAIMRRMPDPVTGGGEYASVGIGGPVVLFPLCPVQQRSGSSELVFSDVQLMRGRDFMKKTGFIWSTGTSKGAKGKKVQWRFEHSSSFVPDGVVEPSLEELLEYLMPRFPRLAAKTTVEAFQIDAANRSPQQGRWFKMILRLAPFTGSFWEVAC